MSQRESAPGIDANDQCAACSAHAVWGYVEHGAGCSTPDVLASPAHLSRRDQFAAALRALVCGPNRADPRGKP